MADTALETFGKAVKSARTERGWTLEALAAEALGNPDRKGYCSQVEKGKRNLSEATIRSFARVLDLPDTTTAPLLNRALPLDDQAEAEDQATEKLLADIEALRTKLKLSEALAVALAYKYAEGSPTDIEGALKGLEAAFETAAEQKARDALPSNIDAAVDAVLQEVARLNDEGQPEDADALLMAEIEKSQAEMERQKAQLTRYYDRAIAQAVLTRDADAYAARQLEKIKLAIPSADDQFHQLRALFMERYRTGLRTGAPFLLTSAISLARQCAAIAPKPYLRAMAQNDQAVALQNQGIRTSGAEGATLLAAAVTAYDTALEVRTREDHPVDWAMTQNNKAIALQEQGIRCSGAQGAVLLAAAVTAYDAALEVYTREDHPVDWAMTQNNKAIALQEQGTRTSGAEGASLLAAAVTAYDAALEIRTRDDHPVDWAITQNNKAAALQEQGTRTSGAEGATLLAAATTTYDAALEVRTSKDHPVDWAITQFNLAVLKEFWAEHDSTSDPGPMLEEALAHVEAALTVFDPEHLSYDHDKSTHLRDQIRAKLDALPSHTTQPNLNTR
ncbi:MAG: helix-turn-helix transcriptional regulator [Pseudomonadota bacterium]